MQIYLASLKKKAEIKIVFQGNFFTVATATLDIGNTIFYAEGMARKSHLDEYSVDLLEDELNRIGIKHGFGLRCQELIKKLSA